MFAIKGFKPRKYQTEIIKTTISNNTLVVLPTGMGKTKIAILTAIERLNKSHSNALIITPTKPLSAQIHKEFIESTNIPKEQIILLTGALKPKIRQELWESAIVTVATPQCVTGDTQIFSKKHGPIKISDFFKKLNLKKDYLNEKGILSCHINEEILGYSKSRIKPVKAIKAWKSKADEIFEIKTQLKKKLKATPEHPILSITPTGEIIWKKAESINKGEFIGIIKEIELEKEKLDLYKICNTNELRLRDIKKVESLIKILKKKRINVNVYGNYRKRGSFPLKKYLELCKEHKISLPEYLTITNKTGSTKPFRLPRRMSSNLSYIIGAMLGDGHIGNRNSKHGNEVVFSDLDNSQISNRFKKKIERVFGILPKEDKRKGLIYYSTGLANVLNLLGVPKGNKSNTIRVPRWVFFQSKETISSFIEGLFNADGCASNTNIEICTLNKTFAKDIQWLLKRIRITSSIYYRKQKITQIRNKQVKSREMYSINFSDRNQIELFLKQCNPHITKCQKLIKNLEETKRPFTRSSNILPIEEGIKLAYQEHRRNGGRSIKEVLLTYGQKLLSINNLLMILPLLTEKSEKAKELELLTSIPIQWVKVLSVKKIKKKETVYDLTIEKEHNFITNHIISHNTIQKDLENNRISLSVTSLLVIDECHRSRQNFANTKVANFYNNQSKFPRILALTASPGGTKSKIEEIKENLSIEAVEIRREEDIKEFIQKKEIEWLEVNLPNDLKEINELIKTVYKDKLKDLKKIGFNKPSSIISKKDLIILQQKLRKDLSKKNPTAFYGLSLVALLLKVDYASELLETQGLIPLAEFWNKLESEETKAAKNILNTKEIQKAISLTKDLAEKNMKHPKLYMLRGLIRKELESNPNSKIIVFANYRSTIDEIIDFLNQEKDIKATKLIGQKSGLTQQEQINVIKMFENNIYNTLVCSSIGEEGIDIKGASLAIMYDQGKSSEIRKIQRAGRVARLEAGKIITLLTRDTREIAYYWSSQRKENAMKKILTKMQESQTTLT